MELPRSPPSFCIDTYLRGRGDLMWYRNLILESIKIGNRAFIAEVAFAELEGWPFAAVALLDGVVKLSGSGKQIG